FLGMTVSCARCHDHKFDPIYTKDYYSLVSYIQSSRQQMAFIDHPERVSNPAKKVRGLRQKAGQLAVKSVTEDLSGRLGGLEKALLDCRKDTSSVFAKGLARSNDELFRPWRVLADPALKTAEAWESKRKELLSQMQTSARAKEWKRFEDFGSGDYRGW